MERSLGMNLGQYAARREKLFEQISRTCVDCQTEYPPVILRIMLDGCKNITSAVIARNIPIGNAEIVCINCKTLREWDAGKYV